MACSLHRASGQILKVKRNFNLCLSVSVATQREIALRDYGKNARNNRQ